MAKERTTNYDNSFQRRLMPPQKISLKKKGKEWREQCVDYVIKQGSTANPWCNNPHRIYCYQENINAYEGVINEEELKYVTNPFNVEDKLPARLKDYNLCRPFIDSMIGEEVNRPFKFTVCRTSENAQTQLQEEIKQKLITYCMGLFCEQLPPEQAQEWQSEIEAGQQMPPDEIQRWANESYKDIAEGFVSHLLKYLMKKLDVRTTFLRGYKDLILNREEIYFVGEEYGHPVLRWVNPGMFAYEYTPDMMYVDEASWCIERIIVSYADFHDRFKSDLTEDTLDEVLDRIEGLGTSGRTLNSDPYQMGTYHWDYNIFPTTGNMYPFEVMSSDAVEVWRVHWKSFRKIYFITLNDPETNHPYTELVDEDYVFTGEEEDVVEDWITQVWQGYRVGSDIYFGIRPITTTTDHNDPTSVTLPYTGLAAQGKSIMELLKPMNTTYLSLWYRLELLIARDNGRVLNMDVTQIPKSLGVESVQQWAHMLKSMGVNLINPYENGWNVPGRDGTRPAAFNAFTSVDLSMSQSIGMYIDLLTKVEQMAQQIIGFNPQRLGQVGHRDLNSTTQEALEQSYNTNALLVYTHDCVKQRALEKLMNVALSIRYAKDDTFLSYVGTDGMKVFLQMPPEAMETMDLFISSSAEEQRKLEELKTLYQPALQNGATLVDIMHMMESDNLTDIRLKLEEIERRKQEMIQQQNQEQQQIQQAQMQQVETDRQVQIDQKNADRTLKKYEADLDAQTRVQIAQIQADTKVAEMSQEADPVALGKLELDQMKIELDAENKRIANENVMQKITQDMDLKQQEMLLRQDELSRQIALKDVEAEAKRATEFRKLELEWEKVKIEREKIKHTIEQLRVAHDLEMKKIREEFREQLRLAKMAEAHDVKMATKEEAKEVKLTKMTQAHDKSKEKLAQQHETKIKKIENEGKIKLQREKYEGDEDIIEKEYEEKAKEEKRKAREAEEKARKKAKESKNSSSSEAPKTKEQSSSNTNTSPQTKSPTESSAEPQRESTGPKITIRETSINI